MLDLFRHNNYFKSYAQCGEDAIVDFLFRSMGVGQPYYIDIGAYHYKKLSNTFAFYQKGGKGICIEANPHSCRQIRKKRPRDICLNLAITSDREGEKDFYILNEESLSSLDEVQINQLTNSPKYHVKDIVRVPARPIALVLKEYVNQPIDFFSLDIEANMEELINAIPFNAYRPSVLCIETLSFDPDGRGTKDKMIIDNLISQGYVVFADTYINTIFADPDRLSFQVDKL